MSLPPPPEPEDATPTPDSGKPWWKKWWAITGGVLLALVVLGGIFGEDPVEEEPTAAETPRRTASPAPPDPEPEPSPEPAPEPEPTLDPYKVERFAFIEAFNASRLDVADELEGNVVEIETVDRFVLDEEADAIVVAASSDFSGEEYHADGAWAAARYLSEFYDGLEHYRPALDLQVETVRYVCPGDVMQQLAGREIDRAGWQAACRP